MNAIIIIQYENQYDQSDYQNINITFFRITRY